MDKKEAVKKYTDRIDKTVGALVQLGREKLEILKQIHQEFTDYLNQEFKETFDTYKRLLIKLKCSVFDCIALKKGVSRDTVWNVFEGIVSSKRELLRERGVKNFLFFLEKDGITEETIEKVKQKGYVVWEGTYLPLNLILQERFTEEDYKGIAKLVIVFTRVLRKEERKQEETSVGKGRRILDEILKKAVLDKFGVSDIHIVPGLFYYYVYFREDGFFVQQMDLTLSLDEAENLIIYLMRKAAEEVGGQFNPDTRLVYQDARISIPEISSSLKRDLDLRIAFIPDGTPKMRLEICIRLLYKQQKEKEGSKDLSTDVINNLKQLGYFEKDIMMMKNILYKKNGIVIVSGITNSGKSTFLSSLLSSVVNKKIGTIEDPIEYYLDLPNYVQHQLFIAEQGKYSMDFVDYVKAFKRADYDIVFIGEWRNHPGLTQAILEQAYAGQLIFTTLHVGSSFQILKGLESVFNVNIEELKPVLLLCWNQVLIPKLCPYCRKQAKNINISDEVLEICRSFPTMTEDVMKQLERFVLPDGYVRGEGCERCQKGDKVGYLGRQVIYDYFLPTVEFWEVVRGDYSHYNVMKSARIKKTKVDVFLQLARMGVVDVNDVYLAF